MTDLSGMTEGESMKFKTIFSILPILIASLVIAFNVHAFSTWHTASGESYNVVASTTRLIKKGEKANPENASILFYVLFETDLDINKDQSKIAKQFHDVGSHLYHFFIPKKFQNDEKSVVNIVAVNKFPASDKEKVLSSRFSKSITEVAKIANAFKGNDANRLAALKFSRQRKYKEALASYKKVSKKVPHDFQEMASVSIFLRDHAGAIAALNEGLKSHPQNVTLLNNLAMASMINVETLKTGRVVYNPQQSKEALKWIAKAKRLDKKHWVTWYNEGTIAMTSEDTKRAEKSYKKAYKYSGKTAELSYRLANFYHMQKKFSKAQSYYKAALKKLNEGMRTPANSRRAKIIELRLKVAEQMKLQR